MFTEEQMNHFTEVLMDFLIERPPSAEEQQEALTNRIVEAMEEAGFSKFSNEELTAALDTISSELTKQHDQGLADLHHDIGSDMGDLATSLQADFDADLEAGLQALTSQQITPLRNHIANMPDPVINNVTHRTTVVHEGDQTIDQRNIVNAEEGADVRIEDNRTAVQADDEGVAIGGDVDDSAVNTGQVDGVQTGSGDINDSIVGDDNLAVMNSEIDTMAVGGDATSIDQVEGNANIGGMQVGIDSAGDVNAVIGNENDLAQDQSFEMTTSEEFVAMQDSFEADAAAADAVAAELDAEFD